MVWRRYINKRTWCCSKYFVQFFDYHPLETLSLDVAFPPVISNSSLNRIKAAPCLQPVQPAYPASGNSWSSLSYRQYSINTQQVAALPVPTMSWQILASMPAVNYNHRQRIQREYCSWSRGTVRYSHRTGILRSLGKPLCRPCWIHKGCHSGCRACFYLQNTDLSQPPPPENYDRCTGSVYHLVDKQWAPFD